jgi:hypothetical protein
MKVAIGYKIQNGPWGGGNAFAKSLSEFLKKKGHDVVDNLQDNDIDIILLTDPRGNSPQISIDSGKIIRYLLLKNNKALIIHRINECDERKGTKRINSLLKNANFFSDHTVFIASWLKNLNLWNKSNHYSVILNGGDKKIFNKNKNKCWDGCRPIRLITHHWGGNELKGMDVYKKIDQVLDEPYWKNKINFTYIGNIPGNYVFKNIKHIKPISGQKLSDVISSHNIYVTASINEPGGMHHIEGGLCGLPILYRESGSLSEYCKGYGVSFKNVNDVLYSLDKLINNYDHYYEKILKYNRSSDIMCKEYYKLFNSLLKNRNKILQKRDFYSNPWKLFRSQILM